MNKSEMQWDEERYIDMDHQEAWAAVQPGVRMACGAREPIGNRQMLAFKVGPNAGGWWGAERVHGQLWINIRVNWMDAYEVRLIEQDPITARIRRVLKHHEEVYIEDLNEVIYSTVNK